MKDSTLLTIKTAQKAQKVRIVMSRRTKLSVSSPKSSEESAKQIINLDEIAERTSAESRQRKAEQKAEEQKADSAEEQKAESAEQSAEEQTAQKAEQKAQSAEERKTAFTERVKSVIDCYVERYDIITDTCADDYIRVNRHSSHKTYLQIYVKKSYVLFLISSASVDMKEKKDSFKHDKKSAERLSNQKCYARYKTSYDSAESFLRALTDYDNRKQLEEQTAQTTATEQSADSAEVAQ